MNGKRGFTLIELMVVISIIGLLSSIVLASLATARAKAQQTRFISEIKSVQNALELYKTTTGKYPNEIVTQTDQYHCEDTNDCWSDTNSNGYFSSLDGLALLMPTYIKSLPKSPNTNYFLGYYTFSKDVADNYMGFHFTCGRRSDTKYILYFYSNNDTLNYPRLEVQDAPYNGGAYYDLYNSKTYCISG